MERFAIFVDGSNLVGSLKSMNLRVDEYQSLYKYIFNESVRTWNEVFHVNGSPESQLRRVYWYVVGSMDDWDLNIKSAQDALRKSFDSDAECKSSWLAKTSSKNSALTGAALHDKAWAECFADFKPWYEKRKESLHGMKSFYQAVRASTDAIDIIEAGYWKVNFINKFVEEKGLDTALAVDMIALQQNYDVALVISGDADSIPSIEHMKKNNKTIAAIEFVNGSPPESKGRSFSSRLKEHADFVVRIYETELVRHKIAHRP